MTELQSAQNLISIINSLAPNSETLIVGGAVRDKLLGIDPSDIDIATNVPLELIEQNFICHDIGKSKDFGIASVKYENYIFEVAHFRTESTEYSDGRRPDSVELTRSFLDDSSRRDFSVCAMGMRSDGSIVDYHNGRNDLQNKIIRAVGNPIDRFNEDPVRIIRAARFAARFGFNMDAQTFTDAKKVLNSERFDMIAPERIKLELFKAAKSGESLARFVEIADILGLLEKILPEIKSAQGYIHHIDHHPEADGCVFGHYLCALRVSRSNDPLVNIAILLHDVGKPASHKCEDGKHKYHGHEAIGVPIVYKIGERFKFSKEETKAIVFSTKNHMVAHRIDELSTKKVVDLVNNPFWYVLKEVMYADDLCRLHVSGGEDAFNEKIASVESKVAELNEKIGVDRRLNELCNGYLIMELTGAKGKQIGEIKSAVHEFILDKGFNVSGEEIKQKVVDLVRT